MTRQLRCWFSTVHPGKDVLDAGQRLHLSPLSQQCCTRHVPCMSMELLVGAGLASPGTTDTTCAAMGFALHGTLVPRPGWQVRVRAAATMNTPAARMPSPVRGLVRCRYGVPNAMRGTPHTLHASVWHGALKRWACMHQVHSSYRRESGKQAMWYESVQMSAHDHSAMAIVSTGRS
jgi:hypothetical protein